MWRKAVQLWNSGRVTGVYSTQMKSCSECKNKVLAEDDQCPACAAKLLDEQKNVHYSAIIVGASLCVASAVRALLWFTFISGKWLEFQKKDFNIFNEALGHGLYLFSFVTFVGIWSLMSISGAAIAHGKRWDDDKSIAGAVAFMILFFIGIKLVGIEKFIGWGTMVAGR